MSEKSPAENGQPDFYQDNLSEVERAKPLEYPDTVYESLLPAELDGKKFLDVGAGAKKALQGIVEGNHGMYIALDNNHQWLKGRPEGNKVQADAAKLPFADKSVDIVHTRFFFLHLTKKVRQEVIEEMSRVGQQAMILEYDWQGLQEKIAKQREECKDDGKQKALNVQERFVNNLRESEKARNIEVEDIARKIKEEVEQTLDIKAGEQSFDDGVEVADYKKFIEWGEGIIGRWRKEIKNEEKAKEMEVIVNDLKELDLQGVVSHSMPGLVVVTF
ncbi:MAG: class I SAM-dependent methyltransferase [Candidatus Staskawiczbacteria bacterium]|nr:class I SAM-dependent methyltransferase [Candidatus Staskawiczbacteria bacterium]